MARKTYPCNSCGAPVDLSMTYCCRCGIILHVDPDQQVWNLLRETWQTLDSQMNQKKYHLQYQNPFDTLEDLRRARRELLLQRYPGNRIAVVYKESPQQQRLIYSDHLVYIQYRQGDMGDKRVKVIQAYHYTATYPKRALYVGHRDFEWVRIADFPDVIELV